jgi:hypothetical protein
MSAPRVGSAAGSGEKSKEQGFRERVRSMIFPAAEAPPALPRTSAEPATSIAASAIPGKPAVAASGGGDLPPGATPYLKGAGVWVPPGTGNGPVVADTGGQRADGPHEVPVKAHMRTVPAAEKPIVPEQISLELLVAEFRRAQRITTQRVILLGCLCERWIRRQLKDRTALDRATATKKIRAELAEAKLERKEARVDLYIRCYWAAVLLGGWSPDWQESRVGANELAFSTLRLFPVLLIRDKTGWQLIPQHAEAARTLWARAVGEHLAAKVVDQEISRILPARTVKLRKHRPIQLSVIQRLLARLKPTDLAKVPRIVTELETKLHSTAAA